ncbi:hypothetical protein ONR57_20405 [Hoyosella sp. YIM 151337]|nr:hypothetical protein [Hoyosella sp. YIM 151337]
MTHYARSHARTLHSECALFRHCEEAVRYQLTVDQPSSEQGTDEVEVLFAVCAKLRDTEILLVETPADILRRARRRGGIRILHLNQAIAPAVGKDRSRDIDTIDTETMLFLIQGPLTGNTLDHVR